MTVIFDTTIAFFNGDTIPNDSGAYAFAVDLSVPLAVRWAGKREAVLPPGRYVYCGSAYGPGGLRARLGRHLSRDKTAKWHVDQLTLAGNIGSILVEIEGSECRLLAALLQLDGCRVPAPGFGSSDCRTCPSHLVALPDGTGLHGLRQA